MSADRGVDRDSPAERQRERERFADGLPGYHDPLAGFGGAPPARSALTLRLVLAVFGLVVCGGGAVVLAAAGAPVAFTVAIALLAAIAIIDIAVIVRRKRRGEPG